MSIDKLIADCKNNCPKAQEQVYQLFSKKLFAVCLLYSSNYTDAQDNLQDGFLTIFNKIHQFNGTGSFEGWAKRIMINTALQKFKNVRFMERVDDSIPIADEVEIEDENIPLDYLLQMIQDLPDQYRLVFSLYVLEDYSHKEIAEMLKISTGTTKSNLARARAILKQKIELYHKTNHFPTAK